MLKQIFTLTALLALVLMLVPQTIAEDATPASTVAPFSVELIGADADTWIDRFKASAAGDNCPRSYCLSLCQTLLSHCFATGQGFAVCLLQYDYCETDCFLECND